MRTRPAWLSYAAKIKSKVEALPRSANTQARRERIVYRGYLHVKEQYSYPGTLGDWEYVVNEVQRKATATRK